MADSGATNEDVSVASLKLSCASRIMWFSAGVKVRYINACSKLAFSE